LLLGKKSSSICAGLNPSMSRARGKSKSVRETRYSSAPTASGLVSLGHHFQHRTGWLTSNQGGLVRAGRF
jgi:hypothetical protein